MWAKKMSSGSVRNFIYKICIEKIYEIYMYKKKDLALNNLEWLICHKIILPPAMGK